MNFDYIKPNISSISISLILVIIVHFASKIFVCAPGPCLANSIYNNYLVYALVFVIIYLIINLIQIRRKKN